MPFPKVRPTRLALVFSPVLLFAAGAYPSSAQALPVASKTADISGFAGLLIMNPDFGAKETNKGVTLGVNLTRYFHIPIAPSLEVRATWGMGNIVNERTLVTGIRGQSNFGRFHPYADFLVGGGTIQFNLAQPPHNTDRSTVFSYGGGLDYDLVNNVQAKFDFQMTHWNIGPKPPYPFTPSLFTVGLAYRIPFTRHNSRR